ncbi:nucleotidyl transferase AbiEii/AbiGii toxin family protein [Micromonospora halotolerans]|uniref:Nucleotidyl transferase AbiEii/AbiGii toxin family protein n=1 Tax=Micromonospora halotolerans TaxID=709879 RepID=A0ABZ0A0L0_9ACTN|nr:nucleotidyl transferase AbiEii/AbiGii toxin family protein [Micromonospora halotolerans]WNM41098.1 nucleotidyl transferase AbiEii/AbiGii toxin family protein [Micromonospora halotolerans]
MDELHRRLLRVGFAAGDDLGLALAGGYALSAHNLLSRPSRDIDFATATAVPLPAVAARLAEAYAAEGFGCRIIEAGDRMARLLVSGARRWSARSTCSRKRSAHPRPSASGR